MSPLPPASPAAKLKLKKIHALIKSEKWESAIGLSKEVLRDERGMGMGCYHALVFAALALSKSTPALLPEAEKAYNQAITLDPELSVAYQGLGKMWRENGEWGKLMGLEEGGVVRAVERQDAQETAVHLQRLLGLRMEHGPVDQVDHILGLFLPDSPLYGLLLGIDFAGTKTSGQAEDDASTRRPQEYTPFPTPEFPPAPTFGELPLGTAIPISSDLLALPSTLPPISQMIHHQPTSFSLLLTLALRAEHAERTSEEKEVEKRRKRLGAGGESAVRRAVGREWLPRSRARVLWGEIERHPLAEDEVRRAAEGRTFRWWYRLMVCLSRTPSEEDLKLAKQDVVHDRPDFPHGLFLPPPPPRPAITKQDAREQVLSLSRGMVLLSLASDEAPYNTLLEWTDAGGLTEYDPRLLHDYVEMFPLSAMGRLIGGYLRFFGVEQDSAQEEKEKRREERRRRKGEERKAKLKAGKEKAQARRVVVKLVNAPAAPTSSEEIANGDEEDEEEDRDDTSAGPGPSTKSAEAAAAAAEEADRLATEQAAQLAAAELLAEAEIARREPFTLIVDALDSLPKSVFAHKVVAEAYLREEDWGAVIATADKGKDAVRALEVETGAKMPASRAVFDVLLGTALVHFYPPKHHPRALQLLEGVLALDPDAVPCIMGQGRIFQYQGHYEQAHLAFQRVVDLEEQARSGTEFTAGPTELQAREEVGWCLVKVGQHESGQAILKDVVENLEKAHAKSNDIARCWWRIGTAEWQTGASARDQAHEYWVQCLRCQSNYAPAFTSMGVWYLEHVDPPDADRASKCFQKAFELDAREAEAARRLAEGYAAETEWALVDQVAKRVMAGEGGLDGGITTDKAHVGVVQKFLPTNAWAWKAAGAAQMAYKRYNEAAVSFQVALRAEDRDASLWTRLGEAYAKSGRHVAALKALRQALRLDPDNWLPSYLIGTVQREIGLLEDAINTFGEIVSSRDDPGVTLALSEAYLAMAAQAESNGLRQRALQNCMRSLKEVCKIMQIRAFRLSGWKLFGDACSRTLKCLAPTDEPSAVFDIVEPTLRFLANEDESRGANVSGVVELADLLSMPWTSRDVGKAGVCALAYRAHLLRFDTRLPEPPLYDLAIALYELANALLADAKQAQFVKACTRASVLAIKKALETDPGASNLWTAFGIVAARGSKQLAQHALIIALGLAPRDTATWCSLGYLSLELKDFDLANKAFVKAQTIEPENCLAWTGQGLVAHAQYQPQRAEAFFDQAVTLSGGSESSAALGLAHLAFQHCAREDTARSNSLHGAAFALGRFCEANSAEPSPLLLLALIQERLEQLDSAISSVRKAVQLLEEQYELEESAEVADRYAIATVNLGRLLLAQGKPGDALAVFVDCLGLTESEARLKQNDRILIARVQCRLGSAIALVELGQASTALGEFQLALAAADTLPRLKSELKETVAVYVARTLWNADESAGFTPEEGRELAKSELLESLGDDGDHSARALATTLAVGLVTRDSGVTEAVQSEWAEEGKYPSRDSGSPIMQEALALFTLSEGNVDSARAMISKAVRDEPERARRWTDVIEVLGEDVTNWIVKALVDPAKLAHLMQTFREAAAKAGVRISAPLTGPSVDGDTVELEGSVPQAQRAVVLEPWERRHWEALAFARSCAGGAEPRADSL